MAAADLNFVNALLRIIKLRGRNAIEQVFLGEFTVVKGQGGGKLVSTSVGGKNFTFQIPSGLGSDALMVACDMALREWDALTEEQRELVFSTRPQRTARAVF